MAPDRNTGQRIVPLHVAQGPQTVYLHDPDLSVDNTGLDSLAADVACDKTLNRDLVPLDILPTATEQGNPE